MPRAIYRPWARQGYTGDGEEKDEHMPTNRSTPYSTDILSQPPSSTSTHTFNSKMFVFFTAFCRGRRAGNQNQNPPTKHPTFKSKEKCELDRRETLPPDYSSSRTDSLPVYQQHQQHQHHQQQQQQQQEKQEKGQQESDILQQSQRQTKPSHDNDFDTRKEREQLTELLGSLFSSEEHIQDPQVHHALENYDYIYNIIVQSPKHQTKLRRRMMLPFNVDINIMSDETHRRLGTQLQPFHGPAFTVPGYPDLKPLGTAEVDWSFCRRNKVYRTTFFVVRDIDADFILGRPAMRQLELYRADPEIAKRLRSSEQG